jgi:hypothetical protein
LFYENEKKGSVNPNRVSVGSVTKAQLEEIANKITRFKYQKISSAMKIVEGTARNMGIHCRLNSNEINFKWIKIMRKVSRRHKENIEKLNDCLF